MNKSENNFSDAITNFNLCNNSFIHNGSTSARESVANFLFNDTNQEQEIKMEKQSVMNRDDVNSFYMDKFNKQIEHMSQKEENKKMKLIGKNRLEDIIKENSYRQFYMMNRMQNSNEYLEFKERYQIMRKRTNILLGFMTMYSIYFLNCVYESRVKVYDKLNDLIDDTPRKIYKINYKLNAGIIFSLLGTFYYLRKSSNILENEFNKIIKERYFNDEFDFSQIKLTLNNY